MNMNRVKFRRICMESSEYNWANILETICPEMLVFGKKAFWMLFVQNIPTNFTNLIFHDVTLYVSIGILLLPAGHFIHPCSPLEEELKNVPSGQGSNL